MKQLKFKAFRRSLLCLQNKIDLTERTTFGCCKPCRPLCDSVRQADLLMRGVDQSEFEYIRYEDNLFAPFSSGL